MKRLGLTLLELMIALAGTAVLSAAMLGAYSRAIRIGPQIQASEETVDQQIAFKEELNELFHHVYVLNNGVQTAAAAAGQRTYFTTNPQSSQSGLTQTSGAQGQSGGASGGSSSNGAGGTELAFTVLGEATRSAALQDSSNDFMQQNQTRGPEGGVVEYEIGLTPVGNASDQKGIFLRQQRPADSDPTQGGYESLLLPDIDNLTFEFWDGTQWQQSWDTTTQSPIRLPAAIRITYSKGNDTPSVFVVQIPLSDATPANPVTNIGSGLPGGSS